MSLEKKILEIAKELREQEEQSESLKKKIIPAILNIQKFLDEIKDSLGLDIDERLEDDSSIASKKDNISWETIIPKILVDGPKNSKQVVDILINEYEFEDSEEERNRLIANFRYAAWNQRAKGTLQTYKEKGKLFYKLPEEKFDNDSDTSQESEVVKVIRESLGLEKGEK